MVHANDVNYTRCLPLLEPPIRPIAAQEARACETLMINEDTVTSASSHVTTLQAHHAARCTDAANICAFTTPTFAATGRASQKRHMNEHGHSGPTNPAL